jgi:hypothetical protein
VSVASSQAKLSVASSKAKLAGLVAHRDPDDPAITEARAALKAAGLQARIKRDVDSWPPLSEAVRAALALLLRPGGDGDAT